MSRMSFTRSISIRGMVSASQKAGNEGLRPATIIMGTPPHCVEGSDPGFDASCGYRGGWAWAHPAAIRPRVAPPPAILRGKAMSAAMNAADQGSRHAPDVESQRHAWRAIPPRRGDHGHHPARKDGGLRSANFVSSADQSGVEGAEPLVSRDVKHRVCWLRTSKRS